MEKQDRRVALTPQISAAERAEAAATMPNQLQLNTGRKSASPSLLNPSDTNKENSLAMSAPKTLLFRHEFVFATATREVGSSST